MATAELPPYPPRYTNEKQGLDVSTLSPQGDQQRMADQTERVYSSAATTAEKLASNILQASDMAASVTTRMAENAIVTLNSFANDRIERTVPSSHPPMVPERWKSRSARAALFALRVRRRSSVVRSVSSVLAVGLTKSAELVGKGFFALFKLMLTLYYQVASMRGHAHVPLSDEFTAVALVGAAMLMAYVRVYDAIEQATTAVFTTIIDASQRYLSHRYGMHVAELTRELVGIAQDTVLAFLMWWRIALRAIISNGALREARKFLAPHVPPELLTNGQRTPTSERVHRD